MNGIDINEYFMEVTDESRATIDYSIIGWKCAELVNKISKQNQEFKQLKKENEDLRKRLSDSLMFKFNSLDNQLKREEEKVEKIKTECLQRLQNIHSRSEDGLIDNILKIIEGKEND